METMSLLWLCSESTASQPRAPRVFTAVPEQYITHRLGLLDPPLVSEAQPNKVYKRLQPPGLQYVSHTHHGMSRGKVPVCDKTRQETVAMCIGQGPCDKEFSCVIRAEW